MANTQSAKKAIRQSNKKRAHNLFWKRRIKSVQKSIVNTLDTKTPDNAILNEELSNFQKLLDKASKNKVIHKNKADRLKSRYAKKVSAQLEAKSKPTAKPTKRSNKGSDSSK